MNDYCDDHSPDIALLLTLARATQHILYGLKSHTPIDSETMIKAIDDALKPFEHYPDPVESELAEAEKWLNFRKEDATT